MPVSVGRHNLARIRKQLKLTQGDVAKLVGCSPETIKAVEVGKLALSEGLAARISRALGFNKADWLLKNDLTAPLPKTYSAISQREAFGLGPIAQATVLIDLFGRLFHVVSKMERHEL